MRWLVILETPKGARVKRFKAESAARFYADAHRTGRYQITIAKAEAS